MVKKKKKNEKKVKKVIIRNTTYPELLSPQARTHSGQLESSVAKSFIAYLSGVKTLNRENDTAYIDRNVTFQHLMWRDSY